jgi:hypothetical protein
MVIINLEAGDSTDENEDNETVEELTDSDANVQYRLISLDILVIISFCLIYYSC